MVSNSTICSIDCSIDNDSHRIWNCENFRTLSVDEGYAGVKEKNLYFSCLGENHLAKVSKKLRKCRIDGSDKIQNRLLQHKMKQKVSAEKPKDSTNLTCNVESVLGLLQNARVKLSGGNGKF